MIYLTICCVLLEDMSYWSTCFTGEHILQDDLQEDTSYLRTGFTGGYVL